MASDYLPPDHHVLRYVPYGKTVRDPDDDRIIGILGTAFRLRPVEPYLSATWIEHAGSGAFDLTAAVRKIRASDVDVRPLSAFAYGQVAAIDAALKNGKKSIRFIHEPEPDNDSHAAVRGWPTDDPDTLDRIALQEWSRFVRNVDIPT